MVKPLLLLLVTSAVSASASSYDFREMSEIHCKSDTDAPVSVSLTVQNETFIGWNGYPTKTNSTANVKVQGKLDGENVNINKLLKVETLTKDRLANQVEFSVGTATEGVTKKLMATLTGDKTTPGANVKFVFGQDKANLVYGQSVGFVSLTQGQEHFKTVAVKCSELRDTADNGQNYMESFEKL